MASITYKGFNMPIMPYPSIDNVEVTISIEELQEDIVETVEEFRVPHRDGRPPRTWVHSLGDYRLVLRKKTGIHPYDLLKSLVLQKLVFNYTIGEEVWVDIETVIEN